MRRIRSFVTGSIALAVAAVIFIVPFLFIALQAVKSIRGLAAEFRFAERMAVLGQSGRRRSRRATISSARLFQFHR
jgi:hypothetical protein